MKDRDCESCKKFSRIDPLESEGYCDAKRTWVDPQEGEDCKMHEFTLHSATKYKDGAPIMSEPEKVYCETDSALIHGETDTYTARKATKNSMYGKTAVEMSNQLDIESSAPNQFDIYFCDEDCCPHWKTCPHTLWDKQMCPYLPHDTDSNLRYLEQTFIEFAHTQDDLIEEYDDTFAKHAGQLNNHTDALLEFEHKLSTLSEDVSINESNIDRILDDLCVIRERLCKITEMIVKQDEHAHIFSNFCGNCTHCDHGKQGDDMVYVCELSGEIVDPDDSSCSMFEPPF